MAASQPSPPSPPLKTPPQPPSHPQYSMQTLMIVVTAMAIIAAAFSFVGVALAVASIVYGAHLAFAVSLGTLAYFCRGHRQTFFIGMFVGAVAPFWGGEGDTYDVQGNAWLAWSVFQVISSLLCGIGALVTRRILERRGWHLPEKSAPSRDP